MLIHRHLFDWLVTGQIVPVNPAGSVRGPRHVVTSGQPRRRSCLDCRCQPTPGGHFSLTGIDAVRARFSEMNVRTIFEEFNLIRSLRISRRFVETCESQSSFWLYS
jgi:hypothetical protein